MNRPDWVVDQETTPSGSLIVVRREDGTLSGYRLPRRSISALLTGRATHPGSVEECRICRPGQEQLFGDAPKDGLEASVADETASGDHRDARYCLGCGGAFPEGHVCPRRQR